MGRHSVTLKKIFYAGENRPSSSQFDGNPAESQRILRLGRVLFVPCRFGHSMISAVMSEHRFINDSPWSWISKPAEERALGDGGSKLLLVYYALCRLESDAPDEAKGCFYASANQIARHSGLSLRSVQAVLPQLETSGLANVLSGRDAGVRGSHIANRYTLLQIAPPSATGAYALTQIPHEIFADNKEPKKPKEIGGGVDRKPKRSKSSPIQLQPIPTELDTPAFRTAWGEWIQHREEKGVSLTQSAASKQLKKVAAWGEARAVAAIDYSIFKNWQGIFEEQGNVSPPEQIAPSTTKTAAPDGWQGILKDLYPNAILMPWDQLIQLHPEVADQVINAVAQCKSEGAPIAQNTL
jgi:hypothetical protein